MTIPFVGALQFPNAGGTLTVIWLVALMNMVNFSDGVDGLAAGLCTIDGIAFSIIAFDLNVSGAAVLAALTAGAALGFLVHNFHPASVFMGDAGANLLGYLLGVVAVVGSLKTNAVVALLVPLVILAVPVARHRLRRRQAAQVRPQALVGGRQPLPSPDGADRVLAAQDRRLPVRLDRAAGRAGGRRCGCCRSIATTTTRMGGSRCWSCWRSSALAFSVYLVVVLEIFKLPWLPKGEAAGGRRPAGPGSGAPPPGLSSEVGGAVTDGARRARRLRAEPRPRRPRDDVETGEFTRVR